jgi:hypothetical protein
VPTGPTGLLRESGYNEQPFYCYRWNTIGMAPYGVDSPGWKGVGDVKQLQDMEFGSATMIALLMRPPMNQPDELANASMLPGAVNPIANDGHAKLEPSYTIDHEAVTVTAGKILELERRLNNTFFGNVVSILSSTTGQDPSRTAEEVRGIKEEQLLQLGGVGARISTQQRIALKRFAGIFGRAGMLPPAPPALLRTGRLRIDFVNPLVSAEKAIGYTAIQQIIGLAIQLGEAVKNGADKLNSDEIMDTAVDILGAKPSIVYSDEVVTQMRQQRAAQANAEKQAAAMPEAAGAIKDLSNTDPQKVRSLLQGLGPGAQAQGSVGG